MEDVNLVYFIQRVESTTDPPAINLTRSRQGTRCLRFDLFPERRYGVLVRNDGHVNQLVGPDPGAVVLSRKVECLVRRRKINDVSGWELARWQQNNQIILKLPEAHLRGVLDARFRDTVIRSKLVDGVIDPNTDTIPRPSYFGGRSPYFCIDAINAIVRSRGHLDDPGTQSAGSYCHEQCNNRAACEATSHAATPAGYPGVKLSPWLPHEAPHRST